MKYMLLIYQNPAAREALAESDKRALMKGADERQAPCAQAAGRQSAA